MAAAKDSAISTSSRTGEEGSLPLSVSDASTAGMLKRCPECNRWWRVADAAKHHLCWTCFEELEPCNACVGRPDDRG
jgi:hypothetical protein